MSPPGTRTTPPARGAIPTSRHQAADPLVRYLCRPALAPDDRRRALVRRCLYEAAVGILEDLDAGEPLGEIVWWAQCTLSPAYSEILLRGLGDERGPVTG